MDTSGEVSRLRQVTQAIQVALAHASSASGDRTAQQTAEGALTTAKEALKTAEEQSHAADASLIQILAAAQQHFATHEVGPNCPLCESSERVSGLAERVNKRLATVQQVRDAALAVTTAERTSQSKRSTLNATIAKARQFLDAAQKTIGGASEQWRDAHAADLPLEIGHGKE